MKVIFSFSLFAALMLCVPTLHAQRVKADSVLTTIVRQEKDGWISVETVSTDIDINEKRSEALIVIDENAVSQNDYIEKGDAYIKDSREKFDSTAAVKKTVKKKNTKKEEAMQHPTQPAFYNLDALIAYVAAGNDIPALNKRLGLKSWQELRDYLVNNCSEDWEHCGPYQRAEDWYKCAGGDFKWLDVDFNHEHCVVDKKTGEAVFSLFLGQVVREKPVDVAVVQNQQQQSSVFSWDEIPWTIGCIPFLFCVALILSIVFLGKKILGH